MIPYTKFIIPSNFVYFNKFGGPDEAFKFSSDLEKIGIEWDVRLRNGSYVEPISEPIEIVRPKYGGTISVIKVRADVADDFHTIIKDFWIPTITLINIDEAISGKIEDVISDEN